MARILLLLIHDKIHATAYGFGSQDAAIAWGKWTTTVSFASATAVPDERDRVYRILGLLPSEIAERIKPDYAKSPADVSVDPSLPSSPGSGV